MAVYVDFAFEIGASHLVAAGWGLKAAVGEDFAVRDADGRVLAKGRSAQHTHARPDVPDDRAVGFVMVFPLAGAVAAETTLLFESGGTSAAGRCTGDALDDFVAFAGDEPFYTLLAEVAAGRLPPLPPAAAALVYERVRSYRPGMRDGGAVAAAFDGAFLDVEAGVGLAIGWILTASPERRIAPALLAVEPTGVRSADAAFDALPRPDLEGFRYRFSIDGRTGFAATFPAESGAVTAAPAVAIVLVVAAGEDLLVTVAVPEAAEFGVLVRRFSEISVALEPEARATLRAGLVRHRGAPTITSPAVLATSDTAAGEGSATPVLLLDHDGRGRDLRDVLAHVAEEGVGPFELVLAGPVNGVDLKAALDGVRRDVPGSVPRLLPGTGLSALARATADGPIVYLRSSMLIQSGLLPWLASVTEARLLGRLAAARSGRVVAQGDGPAAFAADVAAKGLPYAVALAGGKVMRDHLGESRGLLTLPGRMLWAFGRIPDGLGESRMIEASILVGDDPSGPPRFADGRSPQEFDLETIATCR